MSKHSSVLFCSVGWTSLRCSSSTMSSMLIDIVLLILVAAISIFAYSKFVLYQYWTKRKIPQIEPSFPFGNIQAPHRKTKSLGEDVFEIYKSMKAKGWKYAGMYMLTKPVFLAIDLDIIKLIMTKDFDHFVDRGAYVNEKDDPLSANLFALGGTRWRNLRAKLSPTFTSGKMRTMFQTLTDCGKLLEKYIGEVSERREPIDIKNVLGCFSTDIIGSCAFGLECNTLQNQDSAFRVYGTKIFHRNLIWTLLSLISKSFPKVSGALGIKYFPTDVSKFFTDVVTKTVKYREDNNIERKDFLQMLIELKNNDENVKNIGDGKTLTIEEIAAQSIVFFVAGFETSSTTMTFVLTELARNPHIQDKVRKELHEVLRKHKNQITYDSMKELVYLQQVIDETLRVYPPVPFVTRDCIKDYQIPGSGDVIEKGTRIIIPIMGIHYDEEYYKNPTVFDPDRFENSEKEGRHQYAHIPFGEGPRLCIGMRFGLMQTRVGLASILNKHRVTWNTKSDVPITMAVNSFILTAADTTMLRIEKLKP